MNILWDNFSKELTVSRALYLKFFIVIGIAIILSTFLQVGELGKGVEKAENITLLYLIKAILIEEIAFRFIPFGFFYLITKNNNIHLSIAVISSAVFGYMHGGTPHIFMQGVGGFIIYSVMYGNVLNGNILGALIKPLMIHFIYNAILISFINLGTNYL